jgi:hypothetical protein
MNFVVNLRTTEALGVGRIGYAATSAVGSLPGDERADHITYSVCGLIVKIAKQKGGRSRPGGVRAQARRNRRTYSA